MKTVLMVAFHFPPLAGSSGIQRTLRFAQQLPALGWRPLVLSAAPIAYERVGTDLLSELPADLVVERAWALDSARHLAVRGRYIHASARPDRWISWRFDAVRRGLRLIRQHRPDVIWSTYPIATAHVIGAELAKKSGLPWVADFRDPMAQDGYPEDPVTWAQFEAIERAAIHRAAASTFTTPGAVRMYRQRYPAHAERITLLENGYDEESFHGALPASAAAALTPGALTLLHSGIVYPAERDPTQLFQAVAQLHRSGAITPQTLRLRFRAAVHDNLLHQLARAAGVSDYLECNGPIDYRAALHEMMRADGLLVLQAANCNEQIPAKLYEYLRARRPILALTDPAGDTAGVLRIAGLHTVAPLDDVVAIASLLRALVAGELSAAVAGDDPIRQASRAGRSAELAGVFDRLRGSALRGLRHPAAAAAG